MGKRDVKVRSFSRRFTQFFSWCYTVQVSLTLSLSYQVVWKKNPYPVYFWNLKQRRYACKTLQTFQCHHFSKKRKNPTDRPTATEKKRKKNKTKSCRCSGIFIITTVPSLFTPTWKSKLFSSYFSKRLRWFVSSVCFFFPFWVFVFFFFEKNSLPIYWGRERNCHGTWVSRKAENPTSHVVCVSLTLLW